MKVTFNNEDLETSSQNLLDLLKEKTLEQKKGIAVAINNEVVQRTNWQKKELKENDNILIITATQGG